MRINYRTGLFIVVWWLALVPVVSLRAESDSGVLLTKSYPWSPNTEISNAIEFKSLVDHTGYYSLNPGPQERQIGVGLVVDTVYDSTLTARNIASEADLAPLQTAQARLEAISAGSANARAVLAGRLTSLKNEIAYFKQGNFKVNGQWVTGAELNRRRESARASQQQAREDAESGELVNGLARRDLTAEDYAQTMAKLKALHKDDTIAAQQFIRRFEKDNAAATALRSEMHTFLLTAAGAAPTVACANARTLAQLPAPPQATVRSAVEFAKQLSALEGGLYYKTALQQLDVEMAGDAALMWLWTEVAKVDAADLPGAAAAVVDIAVPGPTTPYVRDYPGLSAAVKNLRVLVLSASREFEDHCKQARDLEKLGKTADAIDEYKKAADIAKDPAVLKAIQDLREKSLGL